VLNLAVLNSTWDVGFGKWTWQFYTCCCFTPAAQQCNLKLDRGSLRPGAGPHRKRLWLPAMPLRACLTVCPWSGPASAFPFDSLHLLLSSCALLLRAVVGLLSSLQACKLSSFIHSRLRLSSCPSSSQLRMHVRQHKSANAEPQ
jgi:hypothetical protein